MSGYRRMGTGLLIAGAVFLSGCGGGEGDPDPSPGEVTIEVAAREFWWEVNYLHPTPSRHLTTANEIHIPVGEPVRIEFRSEGGSRSIWFRGLQALPRLGGSFTLRAEEPGVHLARSADFWNRQSRMMRLVVAARPAEEFVAWWGEQLRSAPPPADEEVLRGQQVFLGTGCALCHTVRGTMAWGRTGPDLTHFGSRRTIAAGLVPNSRGHLGAWISDPQGIKPGNHMPAVPLAGEELQALLGYLHSLK